MVSLIEINRLWNRTNFLETSSDESDEDKYAEGEALVGHVVDPKERVTVRNLRIREDTAKYLLNLDLSSAHYDPKTRSMLENPNAPKMSSYKGDDFERYTGDVKESSRLNEFSWDSESKGPQLTVHSNPTQGELLYKKIKEQKGGETKVSLSILDKYGGGEYLKSIPKEMLLAQTEHYVEYTPSGELLKPGAKGKAVVKSKYLEDVMNGNHLEVWGSWWKDQVWGYACCHSTIKAAYCGGRHAIDQEIHQSTKKFKEPMKQVPTKSLLEIHNEDKNGKKKVMQKPGILRAGDGPIDIDQEKLKDAIEKEKKRKRVDDGSSKVGVEMTEEQLEAYRMNKVSREDPMANYKDEEDY
jgi:pre-mRNA-processing factor SLU7